MKNIIITICCIFLPIFSVKVIKTNLCINCKYFIRDNDGNTFGKCSFFAKDEDYLVDYLVNGSKEKDYYYCKTARRFDDMCGIEGKMYIKKIIRNKKNNKK